MEVGAFDLVSHNAMLQGLMGMEGRDRLLPFVRLFYGRRSCGWTPWEACITFSREKEGNEETL